jgi:hypothetical protein
MSDLVLPGNIKLPSDRIDNIMKQNQQLVDINTRSATMMMQQLQSLNFRLEHLIDTIQLSCIAQVTGKFPVDLSQLVLIQGAIRHPHLVDFVVPMSSCKDDKGENITDLTNEVLRTQVIEAIQQWGKKLDYTLNIYGNFAIKDVQKMVNNAAESKS